MSTIQTIIIIMFFNLTVNNSSSLSNSKSSLSHMLDGIIAFLEEVMAVISSGFIDLYCLQSDF